MTRSRNLRPSLNRAVLWLVAAHVVWGASRAAFRSAPRTAAEIAAYRRDGAERYLLGSAKLDGADAIDWLRQNTPADAVVAWRGEAQGPIEFAAALLWPRLLVAADDRNATNRLGRPFARGTRDGRSGEVVLVAQRTGLTVELR